MDMIATTKENLWRRVQLALDTVRPHLETDGGDVELVDITDNFIVQVKWKGACKHCQMTQMTMKAGLEQAVKSQVAEIICVESVDC